MPLKPTAKSKIIPRFRHLPSLAMSVARLMAGLTASASAYQESAPVAPYSVVSSPWAIDQRGSHRAVVQVTTAADAVRVVLPWRRKAGDPLTQNVVVVQAASGTVIANRIVSDLTRESTTVVFQASATGEYDIYYLPFYDDSNFNGSYNSGYVAFANTAGSSWLTNNNLPASVASKPLATLQRFEARLAIDEFWPMEVPMTAAERTALLAANTDPYLLFPDDGRHPIKMRDQLPYRWTTGPSHAFTGSAAPDESYAFQIGVYASTQALSNVRLTFSDLQPSGGGPAIPAASLACLNCGGTNWDSLPLIKTVDVSQGRVQPFWITLLVPPATAAGVYTGQVTVTPSNAPAQTVTVNLTILAEVTTNHGYNDPASHSRLRWLDSQLGVSDNPIPPYTAMTLADNTVGVLGRTLTFGENGMPTDIQAGFTAILQSAAKLVVSASGSPISFAAAAPNVTLQNNGRVEWQAASSASNGLTMITNASMEFDGHVNFKVTLSSPSAVNLSDVALEIPMTSDASSLMAGMGYDGGPRPSSFTWTWNTPHDSLWLGSTQAGLHCELRGSSYNGPLLNLYNPSSPATWGAGSVTVTTSGSGALFRASSGSRTLAANTPLVFEFALLITPVKPLNTALHFGDRYYHKPDVPEPPSDWQKWGVNVINVHHSSSVNPFINWPFATPTETSAFINTYQAQGAKVKLYDTIRELTQYTAEIWALRSLGNEVLGTGSGGGFPWLREHYVNDYMAQWYVPVVSQSTYDASVVTTRDSRWYNYYVEGIKWLSENYQMDGIYLDDVAYDRRIVKRIRRVMLDARPGSRIDLHSNTGFSIGPINQYADFMPYVDRLWFGESWNYDALSADQWLAQVTGIPFGLMGELLNSGGNPWLGTVFGMTQRWGWTTNGVVLDPRPVWKIWDQFGGLQDATMKGWWQSDAPVTTSDPEVKATAFIKNGKTLVALGNFSTSNKNVTLTVNWPALGLDPATAHFFAPVSAGFQSQATYLPDASIPLTAKRGMLLFLDGVDHAAAQRKPVARYWLNEASGTVAYDSIGSYHGSYVGSVALNSTDVTAGAETSLRSVAVNGGSYVSLPATLADTVFRSGDPWTVSFWVRPVVPLSNTHNATLAWINPTGVATGLLFYLESNGSLDYWVGDGSNWNQWPNYNPGTGLQNAWVQVAASFDGLSLRCYRNGSPVKTPSIASFLMPDAGCPITLGLRPGSSPGLDLHGNLTDARFYQGILTDAEIEQLHDYPGWPVSADQPDANLPSVAFQMPAIDQVSLTIPIVASWQYLLESSPDLSVWSPIGTALSAPAIGKTHTFTQTIDSSPTEFYRIRIQR
jgi:hypothetical protein